MSTTIEKRTWAQAIIDAEAFRNLFPRDKWQQWTFGGSMRRRRPAVGDIEHIVMPAHTVATDGLFGTESSTNNVWERTDELVKLGTFKPHIYIVGGKPQKRWGEKYRGIDFREFNHEIWMADKDNWGSVLAIRTGPWELSKALVNGLQRNGFLNRNGYVRDKRWWQCACKWQGVSPEWEPGSSGDYTRKNGDITEIPRCPACKNPTGPEPVIVPCPDELLFFKMAGFQFIPPEKR